MKHVSAQIYTPIHPQPPLNIWGYVIQEAVFLGPRDGRPPLVVIADDDDNDDYIQVMSLAGTKMVGTMRRTRIQRDRLHRYVILGQLPAKYVPGRTRAWLADDDARRAWQRHVKAYTGAARS